MNKLKQYVIVNISAILLIPVIAYIIYPKNDNSSFYMVIMLGVFIYDAMILLQVKNTTRQTFYRFLGYTASFIIIAMFSVVIMAMLRA